MYYIKNILLKQNAYLNYKQLLHLKIHSTHMKDILYHTFNNTLF